MTDLSRENNDEAKVVAISSNGKWIATGGTAMLLKLWSTSNMQMITAEEVIPHTSTIPFN
jgi:WD40 repeat protein